MAKRKKRLIKQIKDLEKQADKHREKVKVLDGQKDTTKDYWAKEVVGFEKSAKMRKKKLDKI